MKKILSILFAALIFTGWKAKFGKKTITEEKFNLVRCYLVGRWYSPTWITAWIISFVAHIIFKGISGFKDWFEAIVYDLEADGSCYSRTWGGEFNPESKIWKRKLALFIWTYNPF